MSDEQLIRIQKLVQKLKSTHTEEEMKDLKAEETERLSSHLNKHSDLCNACQTHLDILESNLLTWVTHEDLSKQQQEEHKKQLEESRLHLKKKHQMVDENTGLALGISVGLSIGTALGLLLFKNIAIGIGAGMAIGVAIGAGIDEEYKKEERIL